MCGFVGEISVTGTLTPEAAFKDILLLSKRRGPDQTGFWSADDVRMGFNRLAILDTSLKGNQPMVSPGGRYALVFNGEIYNYRELISEYGIDRSALRSTSDAEVLCHLIERTSIRDFAESLNGMYAICIYDQFTEELHLLRDFAGIKPLFYGLHADGLVFASQFNQVFGHPAFKDRLQLRPEIMKEYFGLGYMHPPNTVFEGIFQCRPGEFITWSKTQNSITGSTITFSPEAETPVYHETDEQVPSLLIEQFRDVIHDQNNADVKVAAFLSGGVDSPLVTALAHRDSDKIEAYTFGLKGAEEDESTIAAGFASGIGIPHTTEHLDISNIFSIVEEHFAGIPEPFGDHSSIPTYLITRNAARHARVMLSGDGGDEVFWGYPRWLKSVDHFYWFRMPRIPARVTAGVARKFKPGLSSAIGRVSGFCEWTLSKQIHLKGLDSLFPGIKMSRELLDDYTGDPPETKTEALEYLKKNEFQAHLQKVLRKVDLMSMANSLEVRVPFLDKRIIEFSNRIKPELGIKHREPKLILKRSLEQVLPEVPINKRKLGFRIPVSALLHDALKDDMRRCLLDRELYGSGHINTDHYRAMVSAFLDGKEDNFDGIWHIYAWQKWAVNNNLC